MDIGNVNILVEVKGKLHLVAMDKDKLEAIELLVKRSAEIVVPINKTEEDFLRWVGVLEREFIIGMNVIE